MVKNAKSVVPTIQPLSKSGLNRPFWSVMIPTYNPSPDYLEKTLRSVLSQAPSPELMQIEVVDDCSPRVEVAELVRQIAGDRISVHRSPVNKGLAGAWNTCIERSRGLWVHTLHQDDIVSPGFYEALHKAADADHNVGAAFTRFAFIDENGQRINLSDNHRMGPGVLESWLEKLGVEQLIQTPSIVVKRSVYETLGGFRSDLCFTLDWEMWLRIATRFSFWFEPEILAHYRVHGASETSKLMLTAADMRDTRLMLEMTCSYQKPNVAAKVYGRACLHYATLAIHNARRLLVLGHSASACKQLVEALRLSKSPQTCWQGISFAFLWGRLAGARLKRRLY